MDSTSNAAVSRSHTGCIMGHKRRHLECGLSGRLFLSYTINFMVFGRDFCADGDSQVCELVRGRRLLFDGRDHGTEYSASLHLAQVEAVIAPMPEALLKRSKNADKYYGSDGMSSLGQMNASSLMPITGILLSPSPFPKFYLAKMVDNAEMIDDPAALEAFLEFLTPMLRLDPEKRPSAAELLQSRWLSES